jgi:hypothetical protein
MMSHNFSSSPKYDEGNRIKDDEVYQTCRTRGETRYAYKFLSGEPDVNGLLGDVDARIMLK